MPSLAEFQLLWFPASLKFIDGSYNQFCFSFVHLVFYLGIDLLCWPYLILLCCSLGMHVSPFPKFVLQ